MLLNNGYMNHEDWTRTTLIHIFWRIQPLLLQPQEKKMTEVKEMARYKEGQSRTRACLCACKGLVS